MNICLGVLTGSRGMMRASQELHESCLLITSLLNVINQLIINTYPQELGGIRGSPISREWEETTHHLAVRPISNP